MITLDTSDVFRRSVSTNWFSDIGNRISYEVLNTYFISGKAIIQEK